MLENTSVEGARIPVAALVLAGLALLVVVTQMPSFSRETIDWDEATFMVMAQDVLRGHLPYVGLFDNKPPLAFFLLGGAMALFGQTLEVVRWFGDVCIWLSAAMIFAICRTRAGDMAAAVVAAAFVAAHAAAFGLHTSTEIIANVFVTGALWLVLDFGHRRSTAPLAGLLVALAVLTRSNLVFVAVGLGLIYLAGAVRPSSFGLPRRATLGYVLGGLGVAIALAAVYAAVGGLHQMWVALVVVPISYAADQASVLDVLRSVAGNILTGTDVSGTVRPTLALGVVAAVLALLPPGSGTARSELTVVSVVLVTTGISIGVGGVFYMHYLVQLFPSGALLVGLAAGNVAWKRWVLGILAALVIAGALMWSVPLLEVDRSARPLHDLAAAIADDRRPGDEIWAPEGHLILFYLNEPPLSGTMAHPSNLVRPSVRDPLVASGMVAADAFDRLVQRRPRYVVAHDDGRVHYLDAPAASAFADLLKSYDRWQAQGGLAVFRRREE